MKFKKLLSLAVAGAMVFAMAVPALAKSSSTSSTATGGSSSASSTGASLSVPSEVKTPTIDIDVGAASSVIINPYKLKVTVSGEEKQDTFLSSPIVATNKSTTKVDVTAHVTVSAGEDVVVVDKYASVQTGQNDDPGEKNVYMALVVANVGETSTPKLSLDLSPATLPAPKEGEGAAATALATGKYKVIAITAADEEVGFGTSDDTTDKTPLTIDAGSDGSTNYFAIQLFGVVNTKTEETWTENDTISASIVLTFKAQPLDVPTS